MKNLRLTTYNLRLNPGFTLIELLIAASIFSIIILSLYSAFQTGILSYRKMDSAFELYQTIRILFNRMESDLKNSFAYKADDSKFKGNDTSIDFFSVVDSYKDANLNTDVCRIKYELKDKTLMRACYMGLDALKEKPESPIETELSSDIKEISFKYAYITNDPSKPYDWQESWPKEGDANQLKTLPLAVKIKLSLIEKEFTKIVSLPLSEKFSSTSLPGEDSGE